MLQRYAIAIGLCAGLAACAGTAATAPASCGFPPPVPIPELWLSYPEPGATNVPLNVGEVIFVGIPSGFFGPDTVAITSSGGTSIPVGAFTAPPSPLPSPYAIPTGFSGNIPFSAVPVPTLSPSTTYNVSFSYIDWAENPPSCRTHVTQQLGAFTTL
ncbi:MAG TPA: hypothetical protein VGZ02_07945 [Candidatus Baltobacteraceae bacterium]|nr:hypothetical protein [Candidatus Baltobacteraceae bacterium]